MAEYYFEFGFVSRSSSAKKAYSRSSVAKAAYDSRDKLTDKRTGQVYDYRRKGMPEWTGIFLPENAPKWMRNREQLWNELEKREDRSTRPDQAQPSRTWKIAIPREFDTEEKRQRFVIDYGRTLSRQGYVVDLAIHQPEGPNPNWHIHAQLPLRHVTPDGFGGKIRLWDSKLGKRRDQEMTEQKENFCNLAARHLKRYGHDVEAECFKHAYKKLDVQREEAIKRGDRDFADNLDREPTIHEGPAVREMEKKGINTRVRAQNDEIRARNEERAWRRDNDREIEEFLRGLPPASRPNDQIWARAVPVWWALECSKTPQEFQEGLKKENWQLARLNKDDATKSYNEHWNAKREGNDKPPPILKEGEYVAVNERGHIFRLNDTSTGKSMHEMAAFMSPMDKSFVNSLRATENFLQRETKIDARPTGRDGKPGRTATRGAERRAGLMIIFAGSGAMTTAVSLFDRNLTPEERKLRDAETRRAQLESDAIKRAQEQREKDRGGRER